MSDASLEETARRRCESGLGRVCDPRADRPHTDGIEPRLDRESQLFRKGNAMNAQSTPPKPGIGKRIVFFLKLLEVRLRFVAVLVVTALVVGYWDDPELL
jgi:hypothetical protein